MARPVSLGAMVALAQQYADQTTANSQTVQQTFIQFVNASFARVYDLLWRPFQNDLMNSWICPIQTVNDPFDPSGASIDSFAILPGPQVLDLTVQNLISTVSWAPGTTYTKGQIVQNFSVLAPNLAGAYICTRTGQSSSAPGATGPQGNSNNQFDGSNDTPTMWNYFPAFFKLLLVQAQLMGQYWQPLEKFELAEIDLDKSYAGFYLNGRPYMRYMPAEPYKIFVQPTPPVAPTLKIRYVPVCPPLVYLTDIFDCLNGWDEAIELDAAIQARIKEQNEVTDLVKRRDEAMERIVTGAPNRNADRPFRMIRRGGGGSDGGWFGWGY